MRTVLRNRDFRLLLAALAVSQIGDWLYNVALLAYVYQRTASPVWLGVTTAARVSPIVLLGPVAGVLADRVDRSALMIASDVARVAAMLALVGVARWHAPVAFAAALAALATAASSAYPSCVAASVPRLVGRGELASANALRGALGPLAIVLGPALGALVLALGGASAAFGANAATFAVSAALLMAVRATASFRPAAAPTSEREPGLWGGLAAGGRELLRRRDAARLVGADVLCSLCYGVLTVALVAVAARLGWRSSGYGLLIAALGLGGVLGAAAVGWLRRRLGQRVLLTGALLTLATSLPLLAVLPWLGAVLAAALGSGAASLVVEVCAETALAEQLPDAVFGRAYGFAFPASIGAIAVGGVLAAPLTALLGLAGALALVGGVVAGYALWLALVSSAERQDVAVGAAVPL